MVEAGDKAVPQVVKVVTPPPPKPEAPVIILITDSEAEAVSFTIRFTGGSFLAEESSPGIFQAASPLSHFSQQ